jgi:hypothetical protein
MHAQVIPALLSPAKPHKARTLGVIEDGMRVLSLMKQDTLNKLTKKR